MISEDAVAQQLRQGGGKRAPQADGDQNDQDAGHGTCHEQRTHRCAGDHGVNDHGRRGRDDHAHGGGFSHGKSPFLRLRERAAALFAVAP